MGVKFIDDPIDKGSTDTALLSNGSYRHRWVLLNAMTVSHGDLKLLCIAVRSTRDVNSTISIHTCTMPCNEVIIPRHIGVYEDEYATVDNGRCWGDQLGRRLKDECDKQERVSMKALRIPY